jgi:ribulose-5-phosphate 4-epimerase/fuculose-1-phosphate aldolase
MLSKISERIEGTAQTVDATPTDVPFYQAIDDSLVFADIEIKAVSGDDVATWRFTMTLHCLTGILSILGNEIINHYSSGAATWAVTFATVNNVLIATGIGENGKVIDWFGVALIDRDF